jgi:acid stress chaperone HdeB
VGNHKTKSVIIMTRRIRIICACALSFAAVSCPAKTQVIVDLSVITCGQYMGKDRDTQDVLAAWMSGYFNAAKNQSMVDLSRFERNRKAVEKYCKTHKLETLMSAIQRNAY